ncbi:hypothetical protein EMIHUDRAFT_443034 [Emiliania huxleyi CCMP1516]|uniref:AP2/ERF domain-containing protein n=2 Tax=Emiliania huxleyi TaxID=2903 RepID=A0A0D3HZL6_EMIH1|nr:hypothetical protein EMIHUDRAFT_446660 [Emiliania huxleyi CCMP1516]XP_005780520.1 hypothetical protein EMIHUDRAFT_443034 [Emiliania huxleyi CCMP1516]EOD04451.1 hypothetical protein EMIHUDRAFT_446660 [Emiliania huxleyi CCMP1516]EOD28091.1 hypothetical protein EMIHUDRAFT_443034 [Emiliania huxleyi CCMP1516]|eukprot:XP_005756880.1 hypothetical protein EMIHUDRAFT_446660 [Emiliania huxleyi CCMP1516]
MLLFHHTLWVVLIFVAAATRSVFMVKVDLILDGFVNYEFGLFVATFLRRTGASLVWRKRSIVWGCALFAVTRVLQLLVLFYLFIGSAKRMVHNGGQKDQFVFFFALICAVILNALQLYTLQIYRVMYLSDCKREQELTGTVAAEAEGLRLHLSSCSFTGYKGVRKDVRKERPGRFEAYLARVDGRQVGLGTFGTAVEAAVAYARAVGEAPEAPVEEQQA